MIKMILNNIANYFSYIFGVYLLIVLISLFLPTWHFISTWQKLHLSIIILLILSVFSENGRHFIKKLHKPRPYFHAKISALKRNDYLKIGLIILILILSLLNEIQILDFIVLLYGLICILYNKNSAYNIAIALLLLIFCPLAIALNLRFASQFAALFAFYFLLIFTLANLKELLYSPPVDN